MVETKKTPAKAASSAPAGKSGGRAKLRWLLGWILIPGGLIGALFLAGVHVGARHPGMFWSRAVLWMSKAEPGLGPSTPADREVMSRRMLLKMLPGKDYALRMSFSPAELQALADAAGVEVEALDCEAACRTQWQTEEPDKEFLGVEQCTLTPGEGAAPTKLACDATVQR